MTMILYLPFRQRVSRNDLGTYVTYGIQGVEIHRLRIRSAGRIGAISTCGWEVAGLAFRCTTGRLAPRQLPDVVEDFLCR